MKENELKDIGYNICGYTTNSYIIGNFFWLYKGGQDFYKYLEISW